jgi:hypothetical protein
MHALACKHSVIHHCCTQQHLLLTLLLLLLRWQPGCFWWH